MCFSYIFLIWFTTQDKELFEEIHIILINKKKINETFSIIVFKKKILLYPSPLNYFILTT